jgi:HemY protein
LVAAYLNGAPSSEPIDPIETVKAVKRLVRKDAEHRESRLALAEVALAADLWGEARKQLELLIDTGAPARVCRMMAQLEEREGGDAAAAHDWLMRASQAPSDPTWICSDCHATARSWTVICEHCSSFDGLRWEVAGGERLEAIASASERSSTAPRLGPPQVQL